MRELLGIMLRKEGFDVVVADSRAMAASVLAKGPVDMVITDVKLPDGDGIEILRHVKAAAPETVVIVMTAFGSTQTAVAALKLGAHDYLTKPFDIEELKIVVRGSLEKRQLQEENLLLKAEFRSRHGLDRIMGVSQAMDAVFDLVRSVAGTNSTVLITGESGTGKELVAKAIHALSPRAEAPFVSVNCGALTETLLESELFGHMKGAFTDAHQTKKGLFEAAHRGTLLPRRGRRDPARDAGEAPAGAPGQDDPARRRNRRDRGRRAGSSPRPTGLSSDLVRERRFREDLFYRLNVIPIRLPPLRERSEDIPLLAEHFLERFSKEMGKGVAKISSAAMAASCATMAGERSRARERHRARRGPRDHARAVLRERLPEALQRAHGPAREPRVPRAGSVWTSTSCRSSGSCSVRLWGAPGAKGRRPPRILGITPRSLRYLMAKHHVEEAV